MTQDDLLEMLEGAKGELNVKIGMHFVSISPEQIVATMPVEGNRQPYGLLHGGASIALAETLGSTLAVLNAPDGWHAVGVDLNATHHRSATQGVVTATATLLNAGRTLVSSQIVVADEAARRLCTARLTCLLRPPQGG